MVDSIVKKTHRIVTVVLVLVVTWLLVRPSECADTALWQKRYDALASERAKRDNDILARLMAIADKVQETSK